MFSSLGALVAFSQVAEYALNPIAEMSRISEEDLDDESIEKTLQDIIDSFDLETIKLKKQPTLGPSLEKLYNCGILNQDMYESSKFISENRNNFVHNYFMNRPKSLKDLIDMKLLALQIIYTEQAIFQILSFVSDEFRKTILEKDTIVSRFGRKLEAKIKEQLG